MRVGSMKEHTYMKLKTLKLTTYQEMILAQRGYTKASSVTFVGGRSNVQGVDVVAMRKGKWSLIDEDTWTQVVNAMIKPPASVPAPVATAPRPSAPLLPFKPIVPKAVPVMEPALAGPSTPPRVEAVKVRPASASPSFIARMKQMLKPRTYGTDSELVGAANAFSAEVKVHQDLPAGRKHVATFLPEKGKPRRTVELLYKNQDHYNSLIKGREVIEPGDGNCMFYALGRQLKVDHTSVRKRVCAWILRNPKMRIEKYQGMTMEAIALEASRNN